MRKKTFISIAALNELQEETNANVQCDILKDSEFFMLSTSQVGYLFIFPIFC